MPEEEDSQGPEQAAVTLDTLQECLEELLSRKNIAEDVFIQKNMTAELFIPLCILAGHHKIASLGPGAEIGKLLEAAQRSKYLGVDAENLLVKPTLEPRRNTLILHDLPFGVHEQELQELFGRSPEGAKLCSVKPDINQTAFVTFKSDEATQRAALWLRSQTIRNSTVKCSVKSEPVFRGFFFPEVPPAAASSASMQTMMWNGWHEQSAEQWVEAGMQPVVDPNSMNFYGDDVALEGEEEDGEGAGGDQLVGYQHEFRQYTRERIAELCGAMEELVKPESFQRLEPEEQESLLRQSPCKEWAPPPTPPVSFTSTVFPGDAKRSSNGAVSSEDASPLLGPKEPFAVADKSRRSGRSASRRARSARRGSEQGGEREAARDWDYQEDWGWDVQAAQATGAGRRYSSGYDPWGGWYDNRQWQETQRGRQRSWVVKGSAAHAPRDGAQAAADLDVGYGHADEEGGGGAADLGMAPVDEAGSGPPAGPVEEAAEGPAGAAAAADAAAAAPPSAARSAAGPAPPEPEPAAAAPAASTEAPQQELTWADKVRRGSSSSQSSPQQAPAPK